MQKNILYNLDNMGGQSSQTGGSGTPSPLLQANTNSQFTADLSSDEDAYGVELRSLGSFKEVTNCLLEMNHQDAVKVILACREDLWDNPELYGLVQEYVKSSVGTMEFCTALESSLKRAQNSQLIIQLAIKQFEEEVEMQDGAVEKRFEKIVEGLQRFEAAGDPFTPQLVTLFQSMCEQQVSMLNKLRSRNENLDTKLKSMKTWRKVSNVIFVSAFVSVLIFSVVAAAVAAPPVVIALAGAMAVPIGSVGKWCNTLWDRYEKALKEEKGLVKSIEFVTFVTKNHMDSIGKLVEKFQVEIESLLTNADFAIREEDAVKLVIHEIKRKVAVFMASIEVIAVHTDKCNRYIGRARTVILKRILKYADQ